MWNLTVTNIAGIRSGTTTIDNGLNVIQASNFRGKSSLIAALRTVLGASGHYEDHPLTEGIEEGGVKLDTERNQYDVTLERVGRNTVTRTGTPYITDETGQVCTGLFACLDEDNPIRKAVRNDDDLTELLQAPLNIEDIDAQITSLKNEKREIEEQISEAKRAGEQLPSVQENVTSLEHELKELRSHRDELAQEETDKERIEDLRDEISSKSGKLTNIIDDISRLEREVERKQDRLSQKKEKKDELDVPESVDESGEVDTLRDQIDTLARQIDLIEDLYRANQNVVDAGEVDAITDVDRSIAADEVKCWVCGKQTQKSEIEEYISRLQSKTADLREQKADLETKLEEIEARKREVRQKRLKKQRLESDIQELKADVDEKKGILEDKREREQELESDIESLKTDLEDAEEEYNEELTNVKAEIQTAETRLQNQNQKLEELEDEYKKLEELEREQEEIQAELNELRNKKKNTQENLKERFNDIIADIIEEFQPGFSSARLVLKTDERGQVESIELEIARDIDNAGQRTSVDTLSEGEVELISLVVALAGYHAFDVGETTPCILIDGISQLAAEHLRSVATYLDDTSEMLVTTAYPEAGQFDGHVIDPDEWDVVSDESAAAS